MVNGTNTIPVAGSIISLLDAQLPAMFCGKELDRLTGKVLHWRTIQNRRSRGEIPENCFAKISTRKVLILKGQFLQWLAKDIARHNNNNNNNNNNS